jgi:hypothetical protein
MQFVHINCYSIINEQCSQRAHEKLGLNFDETKKCVADSFSSDQWGSETTNNTIIDQEIEYWKIYGSGIYPAIVINNRTYRGQLESMAVFNAICSGFAISPKMCSSVLGAYTPDFLPEGGIRASVIVIIVISLILVNVIIVYCYRRYSKREMQSEMNV